MKDDSRHLSSVSVSHDYLYGLYLGLIHKLAFPLTVRRYPLHRPRAIATHIFTALKYLLECSFKLIVEISLGCVDLIAYLITIRIIATVALIYLNYAVVLLKLLFDAQWIITLELLSLMIQPIALCYQSTHHYLIIRKW
jgi:hypothetical protein